MREPKHDKIFKVFKKLVLQKRKKYAIIKWEKALWEDDILKVIDEYRKPKRPIKAAQFGGGVFLRGFFDWMVTKANSHGYNGDVEVIRLKTRGEDPLARRNYLYTHVARDAENTDISLIDCIAGSFNPSQSLASLISLAREPQLELVVSNTTEAGIAYEECEFSADAAPSGYPATLTRLLYERYTAGLGGLLILPCELIEDNGTVLKSYVLRYAESWGLGDGFARWLESGCSFRNTLVDRIVSGAPEDKIELGYADDAVNTSEFFHLWVIEGEPDPRLPFELPELNIRWVRSVSDHRMLKVRILNGAHTSLIPYALELGVETVGECMKNETLRRHLERCLYEEIIPSLGDEWREEALRWADDVIRRFENPYIHHRCEAIALNCVSKFRVRVLPSILAYRERYGKTPKYLLFSFAMLLKMYKHGEPRDEEWVIATLRKKTLGEILADEALWGCDLTWLEGELGAMMEEA